MASFACARLFLQLIPKGPAGRLMVGPYIRTGLCGAAVVVETAQFERVDAAIGG
jgi:hypothetical protein